MNPGTSRRVAHIAHILGQPRSEVIDRALDAIERETFWQGWDEEAAEYLHAHGASELEERDAFSGTMADRVEQ